MEIVLFGGFILSAFILILCVWAFIVNERAYKMHIKLIDEIFESKMNGIDKSWDMNLTYDETFWKLFFFQKVDLKSISDM